MNTVKIKHEFKVLFKIVKEQVLTLPFAVLLIISFLVSILYSTVLGVLLVVFYILGTYASQTLLPFWHAVLLQEANASSSQKVVGCTVCGDPNCGRQKPVGEHQPWVGLDVPKEFDQALQDLFNKLLNEFVVNWYGRFSKDDTFLWQIRERLRFASAILLRRILKADVGEVICERLLPLFLRHIDDFVLATGGCGNKDEKLATMVAHLGDRVHPAAKSRHSELEYLRAVSRSLTRIGLYKEEQHCQVVSVFLVELLAGWLLLTLSDTLCMPHTINTLLLLALGPNRLQPVSQTQSPKVQFLKSFTTKPAVQNTSVLRSDLNAVLNQQRLLFPVMQFLKRCGAVHLLQFCLDVEDFNRRLLVPDLSPNTSSDLHKEAWDLYSLYLKPDSPDFIHCSSGLPHQLYQVLSRGNEDISRLQTSTPLFQAYEETYSLLEQTYLPAFYQSDLFFELLCGEKQRVGFAKVIHKKSNEPLVSKLSHRLQRFVSGPNSEETGILIETARDAADLDCSELLGLDGGFELRDMGQWKVTIPDAVTEQSPNTRPYPVFTIRVYVEAEEELWEVKRKFDDFYTLDARLVEFHIQLRCELPPQRKGLFSPRGPEFLESRRQELEAYLQKLTQLPQLRYSDLLHCFLRHPGEFQTALRSPMSFSSLLRRGHVVPIKLRHYRGRHLEPFLNTFMASVESSTKTQRNEWVVGETVPVKSKRCITGGLFGDNLSSVLRVISTWPPVPPKPVLMLASFWDCLQYIMWRIIGSSTVLQRLAIVVQLVLGDVGSSPVHRYIAKRLAESLLPRLPHHIRLLQSAILSPSRQDTMEQQTAVREQLEKVITIHSKSMLVRILAPQLEEGCQTILEVLQYPTLNKHVFYLMFDEILRVLFAEFSAPSTFNK